MKTISEYESSTLLVKGSRFFAELFPVTTQEEVRLKIKNQKELYKDASHVCHGFILGFNFEILGCSDDGEPSGTAGRPILEVCKGSGATNFLLTVSRWFGGTLLGTGGLVKAYTESAKLVLASAKFSSLQMARNFSCDVSYELHSKIQREIRANEGYILSEVFGTHISVKGIVASSSAESLIKGISNCSCAQVTVDVSEESQMALPGEI